MRKFLNLLLTGIVAILPISLTIYIVYRIFILIDSISASLVRKILGINIIGAGFICTILFITMVGFITKLVIGQKLLHLMDKLVCKIPIIKTIYSSTKDVSKLLSSNRKKSFSKVVMINFPNDYTKSIGFITNEGIKMSEEEKIAVFIPTTPNPTNGFLVFLDKESVEYLNITVDQAIKMIISMGSISPEIIE